MTAADELREVLAEEALERIHAIDWRDFWATDHRLEEWLVEPILPRGRSIAIYSPAKVGKSLLALDLAVRLATGARVLERQAGCPIDVSYFDQEMMTDDTYERLTDAGYDETSDLGRLHYYQLQPLPPLDTPEGGQVICDIVKRDRAELVIIDTQSRVLSGEENSADTMRAFYIHTGLPLKAMGVTICRLDHAGKDLSRGQRGTSAKADDVDLVWEMAARENGVRLRATHRRQSWIPEVVDLVRLDGPLRHELAAENSWPSGTSEAAAALDALGLPLSVSTRDAQQALANAGQGQRRAVVVAAVKWRRKQAGITSGTSSFDDDGTHPGNRTNNSFGNHLRNQSEPVSEGIREPFPPIRGNGFPAPSTSSTVGLAVRTSGASSTTGRPSANPTGTSASASLGRPLSARTETRHSGLRARR